MFGPSVSLSDSHIAIEFIGRLENGTGIVLQALINHSSTVKAMTQRVHG